MPIADPTRREFLVQSAGALSAAAILPSLTSASPAPAGEVLKVGLVGCGRQGRAILTELAKMEGVKVVGVCDIDASRREAGVKRVEGAKGFEEHARMLDDLKDMSAVIVATPTHLHAKVCVDALAAGRHVYCEAPMAHTLEDARAIARAAGASKAVFQCGLEARANPVYRLARTFFRSDAVRTFVGGEAQHFQKTSWRFPGADAAREKAVNWRLDPEVSLGLVGELGVQQLDAMMWFTDQVPTSASGAGAVRVHDDGRKVADTVWCDFAMPGAARLSYHASLGNSYGGRFEVLRGSNAAIKLAWSHGWMFKEADAPTQGWEVYANRQQFFKDEGITLIADATKLAEQNKLKEGVGLPNTPLYYSLWEFVASASGGKASVADASAGLAACAVVIAAAKAVASGETVRIDPKSLGLGA